MVNQKKIITAQMAEWIERLLLERRTRGSITSIQNRVKAMTYKLVFTASCMTLSIKAFDPKVTARKTGGCKVPGPVIGFEWPRSHKTFFFGDTREEMLEKLRLRHVQTDLFFGTREKNLEKLHLRDRNAKTFLPVCFF